MSFTIGNAAVFAGAGLSRPSGFVVWKELLLMYFLVMARKLKPSTK